MDNHRFKYCPLTDVTTLTIGDKEYQRAGYNWEIDPEKGKIMLDAAAMHITYTRDPNYHAGSPDIRT